MRESREHIPRTQKTGWQVRAMGLLSVLYAGYLGGELVFTKGTGVNHTAWETAGEDYEAVLPVEEVKEQQLSRVTAGGVPVVLFRQGERFCAISATCPHADGRVLTGPAIVNAPRYEVRVRNGQVEVKRASST